MLPSPHENPPSPLPARVSQYVSAFPYNNNRFQRRDQREIRVVRSLSTERKPKGPVRLHVVRKVFKKICDIAEKVW